MVGEGPQSGGQVASHSCVSWLHRWRNLSRAELLPIRHAEVIPGQSSADFVSDRVIAATIDELRLAQILASRHSILHFQSPGSVLERSLGL